MMNAVPASVLRVKVPGDTLAEVLPNLRDVYSGTIAYEIEHISNAEQRDGCASTSRPATWRPNSRRSGKSRSSASDQGRADGALLAQAVHGQKTFSIEGLDVMVPMLEETISMLAEDGTQKAVIGMAHRGRLSSIAHVVRPPLRVRPGRVRGPAR